MRKLLAKLTVVVILLFLMRQHIPPSAAYSLRPLSHAEKNNVLRLPAGHYEQDPVALTELKEVRICRLADGIPFVDAYEYVVDNFGKDVRPIPIKISKALSMIEAAARAEVAKRVEKGLLPSENDWQDKAVRTIVMSSLPTLEQSLLERADIGSRADITALIDSQVILLANSLREINRRLLISPEDDFGFAHLRPALPMPAAAPAVSADPSGAI